MDLGNIISYSFRFPFRDLKHLALICVLFVFTLILPFGLIFENRIVAVIGLVALLAFFLIFPGYLISVVKSGINQSYDVPNIKPGKNIVNTINLIVLHICLITLPTLIVFLICVMVFGFFTNPIDFSTIESSSNQLFGLLSGIISIFVITGIVSWILSIFYYIAKARLASYDSLAQALKFHKSIEDIKKIGIGNFIGWYLVMGILVSLCNTVASLLIFIPYVGLIIYVCIAIPVLSVIYYYSLGLLYSDISDFKKDDDLESFEKELEMFKMLGRNF